MPIQLLMFLGLAPMVNLEQPDELVVRVLSCTAQLVVPWYQFWPECAVECVDAHEFLLRREKVAPRVKWMLMV